MLRPNELRKPTSLKSRGARKRPHVALLIDMSSAYGRGLLNGIYAYVREHDPWSTSLTELGRHDPAPNWLIDNLRVDGIIARIENDRIANAMLKMGVPVVNVSSALRVPQFPWIVPDHAAIAQIVAEHYFQRGFRHLGFCGNPVFRFSNWREKEFSRIALDAGCSCSIFRQHYRNRRRHLTMSEDQQQLGDWVLQIPKPVGVMACNDIRAQQLLEVCDRLNIAVPEEVSVVGVDNDEILCSWTSPPLSSVVPDAYRPGYEAARVLNSLMEGKSVSKCVSYYEPLGIVTRQSSDFVPISDPNIARALSNIRTRACEGIKVADVVKELPLSRRMFEMRFTRLVGRTPHDEILRLQFQKVTQLLKETSLPVSEVAKQAGFSSTEYLSASFKRRFGVAPSKYRHKNRSSYPPKPGLENSLSKNNGGYKNSNGVETCISRSRYRARRTRGENK
jgi:LacI family transcriptional regulator